MAIPRAVASAKELADDGTRAESREGDGGDELLTCRGDDDLYFSPFAYQQARQDGGFVGRYTPRDTEDDVLTVEDAHYSLRVSW